MLACLFSVSNFAFYRIVVRGWGMGIWGKRMAMLAMILAGFLGLLHVYILVMEMWLWQTPRVRKVFGTSPEFAASTKSLAANQGLYNGFLAAGLF